LAAEVRGAWRCSCLVRSAWYVAILSQPPAASVAWTAACRDGG
jgi:hypothetical protein